MVVSGLVLASAMLVAAPSGATIVSTDTASRTAVDAATPTPIDPHALERAGPDAPDDPVVMRRSDLAVDVGSVDLGIVSVSPQQATYGTGIIMTVRFDHPVPWASRKAVTKLLEVKSTKDLGEAGWAWTDSQTARFRPREFWPAYASIRLVARPSYATLGLVSDADGRPVPLRWAASVDHRFTIGRSQVIKVNGRTDQAVVTRDGKKIRTMGVSLGKPGWETRSGVKVLMDRYEVKTMTSGSIGAEEEYSLEVPYAVRLTDSGEFIHGAPWANNRIGRWNGSHGCTNIFVSDARWLYSTRLWGDPVITTGTNRYMTPENGMGGAWNVPWQLWSSGGRMYR